LVAIKKKKQLPFQIWGTLGSTTDQKERRANEKRSSHTASKGIRMLKLETWKFFSIILNAFIFGGT
jgi:hypothetical protein